MCECGKHDYPNRKAAKKAAKGYALRANAVIDFYKCPKCDNYHLTCLAGKGALT